MIQADNQRMRTTIDIHDRLLVRAKQIAAERNKRLSDVVNDALLEALERTGTAKAERKPYRVTPLKGDGPQPGVDLCDNRSVMDAMDDELRDPDTGRPDLNRLK